MATHSSSHVEKAKRKLVQALAAEPGFVGAGVSARSSGEFEIVVLVKNATSPVLEKVPAERESILVRTQVGG